MAPLGQRVLLPLLHRILGKIISPNQWGFLEGKWIAENSVLAQELVYKINKHKGKNGLMLMKIDLKKAFNIMEWSFIVAILGVWGFSADFQELILSCLNTI